MDVNGHRKELAVMRLYRRYLMRKYTTPLFSRGRRFNLPKIWLDNIHGDIKYATLRDLYGRVSGDD